MDLNHTDPEMRALACSIFQLFSTVRSILHHDAFEDVTAYYPQVVTALDTMEAVIEYEDPSFRPEAQRDFTALRRLLRSGERLSDHARVRLIEFFDMLEEYLELAQGAR
jgi:hypothetical protein